MVVININSLKKFTKIITKIIKEIRQDDLLALANEVTYNIILALFPFLIFLMTILGFINIDVNHFFSEFLRTLPSELKIFLEDVIKEIFNRRYLSLMSVSLFVSIFSASSGFMAIIKGVNKSYGQKEQRNFIYVRIISIFLVLLFTFAIISSLVLIIYRNFVVNLINKYVYYTDYTNNFLYFITIFIMLFVLLFTVMLIYKFSCCKRISFKNVLPGSIFTVIFWELSSKIYSVYVENFTNYSKVYGSLGNIFILLIWLNLISSLLLIGSKINAVISSTSK